MTKAATLPDYHSDHHTVSVFGRLLFWVSSNSRKGLRHLVDLEPCEDYKSFCSCEAHAYGTRPCRHCVAALAAIAEWTGVPEDQQDEWSHRLTFLISLGYSFKEAIEKRIETTNAL